MLDAHQRKIESTVHRTCPIYGDRPWSLIELTGWISQELPCQNTGAASAMSSSFILSPSPHPFILSTSDATHSSLHHANKKSNEDWLLQAQVQDTIFYINSIHQPLPITLFFILPLAIYSLCALIHNNNYRSATHIIPDENPPLVHVSCAIKSLHLQTSILLFSCLGTPLVR
jgi:hypothetical protein